MRISDAGIAQLIAHEAIVPYRYRDAVGVDTWGIGHTASAGPPDPATLRLGVAFSLAEVFAVFLRDLARFEARVRQAVKVPIAQHEFDALVSFDFNTGGVDRAELTAALNAGDRATAAARFMGWSRPATIVPRRRSEQSLFATGVYAGDGLADIFRADATGRVDLASRRTIAVLPLIQEARANQAGGPAESGKLLY